MEMNRNRTQQGEPISVIFATNDSPKNADFVNQRSFFFEEIIRNWISSKGSFSVTKLSINSILENYKGQKSSVAYAEDIEFSRIADDSQLGFNEELSRVVLKFTQANIIILDNCYLWPLVKIAKQKNPKIVIVYIGHNIEVELKATIASLEKWPRNFTKVSLEFLTNIEQSVVREADLIFACSDYDLKTYEKYGAKQCLLVPNGANKRLAGIESSASHEIDISTEKFLLYVASGHPPNVHGFIKGIGMDLGFMPPNSKIVVVGTSGNYLMSKISESKYRETFLMRGKVIPECPNDLLARLYKHAEAILLPIFEGGGTNIKTAEAFLNGKKIIATQFSLRGFDLKYWNLDKLKLVSDKMEFRSAIINVLSASPALDNLNDEFAYSWQWISDRYLEMIEFKLNELV